MRPRSVTAAAAMLVLVTVLAACGRSGQVSRQQANALTPSGVQPGGQQLPPGAVPPPGQEPPRLRTMRIRVYAGPHYRAQNLRWKFKFKRLVNRVNEVTRPALFVQLKVADMRSWERQGTTDDLFATIAQLTELDAGDDVDLVIGLVTALPQVSTSLHDLGAANLLGRHLIMRGMNDVAERQVLDERLRDGLSQTERAQLYQARRHHKELVVFLHELGHSLGAIHTREPQTIMYPAYNDKQEAFAEPNRQLMVIAVEHRHDTAELYSGVAAFLENNPWPGFITAEYEQLLALTQSGPSSQAAGITLGPDVSQRGRKSFGRALQLFFEGKIDDAWKLMQPLTEQYDREPAVLLYGCVVAASARQTRFPAPKLCERAAALHPADPTPSLVMATAYARAGEKAHALELIRVAHTRLEQPPTTKAAGKATSTETNTRHWKTIALYYQSELLLTWLEQTLPHLDKADADAFATWIVQTRNRYAVPANGERHGIPPELEGEYLNRVKQVFSYTYSNQSDRARSTALAGLKRFPGAPGFHVALCDLELRNRKWSTARKHCSRALAAYPDSSWGHYLTGVLQWHNKRYRQAATHFERTIELDPTMKAAWKQLAREYQRSKDSSKLHLLEATYQARFNEAL